MPDGGHVHEPPVNEDHTEGRLETIVEEDVAEVDSWMAALAEEFDAAAVTPAEHAS